MWNSEGYARSVDVSSDPADAACARCLSCSASQTLRSKKLNAAATREKNTIMATLPHLAGKMETVNTKEINMIPVTTNICT